MTGRSGPWPPASRNSRASPPAWAWHRPSESAPRSSCGKRSKRAWTLVAQVKDSKVLEANSPVGIAAGALYLASEELGVPLTQAQIARLTGVSEVTIRKHYRLLKESLAEKETPLEAA